MSAKRFQLIFVLKKINAQNANVSAKNMATTYSTLKLWVAQISREITKLSMTSLPHCGTNFIYIQETILLWIYIFSYFVLFSGVFHSCLVNKCLNTSQNFIPHDFFISFFFQHIFVIDSINKQKIFTLKYCTSRCMIQKNSCLIQYAGFCSVCQKWQEFSIQKGR